MPASAIPTSKAVGRLLKEKRVQLKLTLREVSDLTADEGERIPASTLARVETGALDPGIRRLNLLLRLYRIPAQFAADVIELERTATDFPVGKSPAQLYADGIEAWKRGDEAGGLAHLMALRRLDPRDEEGRLLRQKGTLTFAIAAHDRGKARLARELVSELLEEPPHPSLLLNTLVHASTVWRSLGSLHSAMAYLREAETIVEPGDRQREAWLLHSRSRVLSLMGRHAEAEAEIEGALDAYRSVRDEAGELKALQARIDVVQALGETDRALEIARATLSLARERRNAMTERTSLVKIGRVLVAAGDAASGVESLREGLALAILHKDPHTEFTAHYHLWKAYESLGDAERAAFEREAARYFVTFNDQASPEAEEVRRLNESETSGLKAGRRGRRSRP